MAKGDPVTQTPNPANVSSNNAGVDFFNRLGGVYGVNSNQPNPSPQQPIAPSGNAMQQFFQRLGGGGFVPQVMSNAMGQMGGSVGGSPTPQQPYTASAMQASPIAPTNPQNLAATFFKNLGAY